MNLPLPDSVVASGDTVTVGDRSLQVVDAGPGEAACMLMLFDAEQDTLFCADVVQHNMTAFLLEGRLTEWLQQLDTVSARFGNVTTVYPGHGASGTARELFAYQKNYLLTFQQLLQDNRAADGSISDENKARLVNSMNTHYPGYLPVAEIPDLLEQNIDALQKQKE